MIVVHRSYNNIRYWSLIIISLILLQSCKNAPSQTFNNPIDPEADTFIPTTPQNLSIKIKDSYVFSKKNALILNWDIPKYEKFIHFFKVFRSYSDTTNFHEIEKVSFSSRDRFDVNNMRRYEFIDKQGYNGFNVWYKVIAYYNQNSGTVSASSSPVLLNKNVLDIHAELSPFSLKPALTLKWSYPNLSDDLELRIYSKVRQSSNYNFISSLNVKSKTAQIPLDLHQNPNNYYYYKLVADSLESDYIRIETSYLYPAISLLESTEFDNTKADFHIGIAQPFLEPSLDNYTVKIYKASPGDTTLVHETKAPFATPYTSSHFDGLQKEFTYYMTIQGIRGNYKTPEFDWHLFNQPKINSKITQSLSIQDNILPYLGINGSGTKVTISSKEENPVIIDLINYNYKKRQINLDVVDEDFIPEVVVSQFGDYGSLSDAVITSNSKGHINVWNPATLTLEHEIPNFKEHTPTETPAIPIGFTIISKFEMVIAYARTPNIKSKKVDRITLTKWNNTTQAHTLLYDFSYNDMILNYFKMAYQNDLLGIVFRRESDTELITINMTDNSLEKRTIISKLVNKWNYINLAFGNNGSDLIVYTNNDITRYQANTHAFIDRFVVGHSTDWIDLRGFTSSKNKQFFCYGGNTYNSYSFSSDIVCANTLNRYNPWIRTSEKGILVGLKLFDSGKKLIAVFTYKVMIFDLTPGWIIE